MNGGINHRALKAAVFLLAFIGSVHSNKKYQGHIYHKISNALHDIATHVAPTQPQITHALELRSLNVLVAISHIEKENDFVYLEEVKKTLKAFQGTPVFYPDGFPSLNVKPVLELLEHHQEKILDNRCHHSKIWIIKE